MNSYRRDEKGENGWSGIGGNGGREENMMEEGG
jgi:hypothetical protein